ncbi:MAG: sigma-54 interaction domain-containing protein [Terriglobia bacterium]
MPHRLIILEDPHSQNSDRMEQALASAGAFTCERITWDASAPGGLIQGRAQLILACAANDPAWAANFLEWLRLHPIAMPTLAILPESPAAGLLDLASATADDFMCWPVKDGELFSRILRLLGPDRKESADLEEALCKDAGLAGLIGRHPTFMRVVASVPPIAATDLPVVLSGETGTGKELFARAIHHLSPRRDFPFIPVDCGAIPEHLAENEMFGHARGAYTGAHSDQRGLAAMAEGGTLFLDEIDSLSLAAQAKLLRLVQEGTYRAIGAARFTEARIRVIAATNRDLESCVRQKQFRADLFFRINVLELHLPPLRERRSDIALLSRHFLDSIRDCRNQSRKAISPSALRLLEQYDWPGNIRELFNVLQRAAVFSGDSQILPAHIRIRRATEASDLQAVTLHEGRRAVIENFERGFIADLLRKHHGNITRAAADAHKERRAFGRLVKKYNLHPSRL